MKADFLEPPVQLSVKRDPLVRDWIHLRAETLNYAVRQIRDHARSLNPDILLTGNTLMLEHRNRLIEVGVDIELLGRSEDFIFNESFCHPRWDGRRLISSIRSYKFAAASRRSVAALPYLRELGAKSKLGSTRLPEPDEVKLGIAESLACGGSYIAHMEGRRVKGGVEVDYRPWTEAVGQYYGFVGEHADYFVGDTSAATVAPLQAIFGLGLEQHLSERRGL